MNTCTYNPTTILTNPKCSEVTAGIYHALWARTEYDTVWNFFFPVHAFLHIQILTVNDYIAAPVHYSIAKMYYPYRHCL